MPDRQLHISSSPHVTQGLSTPAIMRNVVWALIPAAAFAVYVFGLSAFAVIGTSVIASVLSEHLLCRFSGKRSTVGDWSAVITGLLLGLTLPPSFPLWMAAFGAFIAIALGKYAFGGLGYNVFNPALVGRVVMQAAFPVAITTWTPAMLADRFQHFAGTTFTFPFMAPKSDAMTGATPLAAFKFDGQLADVSSLALGLTSGSAGETSAVLLLLGALYLIGRKMMNWRIPVAILGTVALFTWILQLFDSTAYPTPGFMLFAGGLMLGALFMATDLVASPVTPLGVWIYGILIGLLVVVIRIWGGQPEGVMYAILLGNAVSPQIDRLIQPRVYGT